MVQSLTCLAERKRGERVASESSEDEDDEDDEDGNEADDYAEPFADARPDKDEGNPNTNRRQEDDSLGGFIEDDGDDAAAELPPEFSMDTFQDLVHHFKIICQLFVHLAVQRRKDRRSFMERSLKGQVKPVRQKHRS